MHVVLVEPEIPPNTGNIARTCAATGSCLHLVEPLGFSVSDRYLRRAGLDYWEFVHVRIYPEWKDLVETLGHPENWYYFTSHSSRLYSEACYTQDSVLVFGKESTGLPKELLESYSESTYVIPMKREIRSLNLSNAVAIVVYEAMRQQDFRPIEPS